MFEFADRSGGGDVIIEGTADEPPVVHMVEHGDTIIPESADVVEDDAFAVFADGSAAHRVEHLVECTDASRKGEKDV
jgi:hypothetical protein